MSKIDIDKIKQISIVDYLRKCGMMPIRSTGKYRSYLSPFGREGNPSFKVNTAKNTFVDYHAKIGGDIIDLVCAIEKKTFKEAIDFLASDSSISVVSYIAVQQPAGVVIHAVEPLSDVKLIDYYTNDRKVSETVLMRLCKQVQFSFPLGKSPDKKHWAVGFKTAMNSWELRASWIKICSPPKSFSFVAGLDRDINMFEGFTDFLSYMTYYGLETPEHDTYILNGTGQFNLVKPFCVGKKVYYWGDNDNPGDEIYAELRKGDVEDMRILYAFYNDFNQFLCDC